MCEHAIIYYVLEPHDVDFPMYGTAFFPPPLSPTPLTGLPQLEFAGGESIFLTTSLQNMIKKSLENHESEKNKFFTNPG